MSTEILERNNLTVTRHAGHCGGCGAATLMTREPTYQLTTLATPEQKGLWASVCMCAPCVREAWQAIEADTKQRIQK